MDASALMTPAQWEAMWAPYDLATYQEVLKRVTEEDIVLEIGAGDFRLAMRLAQTARRVYGIEIHPWLVSAPVPSDRVVMLVADATSVEFPQDVSVGVLLMRHCQHFRLYAEKLKAAGAERLITNARWRMGVETVYLGQERTAYDSLEMGWYACWCGRVGFKPGAPEKITPDVMDRTYEVFDCPGCIRNGED